MRKSFARVTCKSLARIQEKYYGLFRRKFEHDLSFTQAVDRYPSRDELYAYMYYHYCHLCPGEIRRHREYYKQDGRGFGEDVFHAMWFTLLREFRPMRCLEIGVYRGQVVSLWALLARYIGFQCEILGVSPFTPAGDEVSAYLRDIDYHADTLQHHRYFGLPEPGLVRALSTEPEALRRIQAQRWDLVYVDGNHDYEVALADYRVCRDSLSEGGLLVMDDSSLYTDYHPRLFSFAGHPGPSRVVNELAMEELCFLGAVGHNNVFTRA